ncbi:MAG TPA: TonB-dependent receptor [Polyangia bacterium]|nr:TonB-dependent receptor [Polyangia bacterium]
MDEQNSTHQKALRVNMDATSYGSFAEIGAGQEVARWFFRVGGAARTVAQSLSAYDMAMSDAIYGPAKRYVSRQRLESMLAREYNQLVERLGPARAATTAFFSFANTVATRRHGVSENGRCWVGIQFQSQPGAAPSQILAHVNLLDTSATAQQEAVGIFGVNLVHAALLQRADTATMLRSLLDGLSRERVEVDMVRCTGPAFAGLDNRLVSLLLVEHRLTDAAMFTANGDAVQPSEMLHKRPILVERGSFRPPTKLTLDLLDRARQRFMQEPEVQGKTPVVLAEITLHTLSPSEAVDHQDFLDRCEVLRALGIDVLLSRFRPYYQLSDYLANYSDELIGIAVGMPTVRDLVEERYYEGLQGGALESIGRLFKRKVKMYVYPTRQTPTSEVIGIMDGTMAPNDQHIRARLIGLGRMEGLQGYDARYLSIRTPDVFERLQRMDPSWEEMVPEAVARIIKEQGLFRYGAADAVKKAS